MYQVKQTIVGVYNAKISNDGKIIIGYDFLHKVLVYKLLNGYYELFQVLDLEPTYHYSLPDITLSADSEMILIIENYKNKNVEVLKTYVLKTGKYILSDSQVLRKRPNESITNLCLSLDKSVIAYVDDSEEKTKIHIITETSEQVIMTNDNGNFGSNICISNDNKDIFISNDNDYAVFYELKPVVYWYQRVNNTYELKKKITAESPGRFGKTLTYSDGYLYVSDTARDLVYVYKKEQDDFVLKSKIKSPFSKNEISRYGNKLTVSADNTKLIVGAPNMWPGKLCVYTKRNKNKWRLNQIIEASNQIDENLNDIKLTASGDTLLFNYRPWFNYRVEDKQAEPVLEIFNYQ